MEYGTPIFGTVACPAPEAPTTHGRVRGENRDGVAVFRGIPYGQDTSGSRRFLPPEPAADWGGVRDCTKNGPICWQYAGSIPGQGIEGPYFSGGDAAPFGVKDEIMSENCLCLNVLTPGLDDKKRSVLVYIHGGGYFEGSGALALGSDKFVREQDVVLVSMNHRLNMFGYLYLGAFDEKYASSGMAGMLDLVLALEWVRDNIASFGGDPEKVTIMGESGGGSKVSTLLEMPAAKGLFRYAIVESGSRPVGTVSREEAAEYAKIVMQELNLTDWRQLLTVPAKDLFEVTGRTSFRTLSPVADGIYLEPNPDKRFRAPDCSRDVTVVVGSSEDEMASKYTRDCFNITRETLRDRLLAPTPAPVGPGITPPICTEETVDKVIEALYATGKPGNSPAHQFYRALAQASGGGPYKEAMAYAQRGTAPVYQYLVSYDTPHPMYPDDPSLRFSWHTADLPMQMRVVLHPEMEGLSRKLSSLLGAFVRNGDPSTEEITWPAFTQENQRTLVMDEEFRVEIAPLKPLIDAIEGKA